MALTTVIRDTFTGGDDAEIDGRNPDGGGSPALAGPPAVWAAHPYGSFLHTGNELGIVSGVLVKPGFFEQHYVLNSIAALTDAHGARAVHRFPATETAGTSRALFWEDDFEDGVTDDPLDGRTHDGATWVRDDADSGSGAAILLDGAGNVYQPDYGDHSHVASNYAVYRIDSLAGLPDDYDYEIDVVLTSFLNLAGFTNGEVGGPVRMQTPAAEPLKGELSYYYRYFSADPSGTAPSGGADGTEGFWHARCGGTVGGTATASQFIPVTETRTIEVRVRGGVCTTYFGGTPGGADGAPGITYYDGMFGDAQVNYDSGPPGLRMQVGGLGEENSYRIAAVRIYTPATYSGGDEFAYLEAGVRHDPALSIGYQATLEFSHSTPDAPWLTFYLYEFNEDGASTDAPNFNTLFQVDNPFGVVRAHDHDYDLRCEVTAAHILTVTCDGVPIQFIPGQDFVDLVNDVDQFGDPINLHTGGVPSLSIFDGHSDGFPDGTKSITCSLYDVLGSGVPCTGPPPNPYPTEPPPSPPQQLTYLYEMLNTVWRQILAPVPGVQVGDVHGQQMATKRLGTNLAIQQMATWRFPAPDSFEAEPPPPETEFPPFYDPCNLLPEQPPDLSGVPLQPLGDRFFGMGQIPVSVLGGLWTGTQRPAGPWTMSDAVAAAAKSCKVVAAQGSYDKFKVGGRWSLSRYFAFVDSDLVPILAALQHAGCGYYSMMDDFSSSSFWGPGGIPISDLITLAAYLHSRLPGVRIGIRALPSQFSGPIGVDFYTAQYVSWRGTPDQFRAAEQGRAISWSAYIILSQNYVHGGNGDSGIRVNNGTMNSGKFCMSPAEVVYNASRLYTVGTNLIGALGYQYGEPLFMGQVGILDALGRARNYLAALP